jgi:hypothetical protein
VAHVEALRLENHFLRQSVVDKKGDENEVNEIHKKYNQALELTEVNSHFKSHSKIKTLIFHSKIKK